MRRGSRSSLSEDNVTVLSREGFSGVKLPLRQRGTRLGDLILVYKAGFINKKGNENAQRDVDCGCISDGNGMRLWTEGEGRLGCTCSRLDGAELHTALT